jgi:hypothetical protein
LLNGRQTLINKIGVQGMVLRTSVGTPLPPGLRYVVVFSDLEGPMPPPVGSPTDVALLEAANLSLRRHAAGVTDAFLFVMNAGGDDESRVAAIRAYGFPDARIQIIGEAVEARQGELLSESADDDPHEGTTDDAIEAIRCWMKAEHPASLPFPGGEYPLGTAWWMGIERVDILSGTHCAFEWGFSNDSLAELLPCGQRKRAGTWLSILEKIGDPGIEADRNSYMMQQRSGILAAVLASWLNGFETASGNGFYDFDPTWTVKQLAIDEFMLGHELAGVRNDHLEVLCDEHECDLDDLPGLALRLMIEDRMSPVHGAMTDFFGGEVMLFCSLYWSIWPKVEESMSEAMSQLTGDGSFDRLAELGGAWRFAADGYWEET